MLDFKQEFEDLQRRAGLDIAADPVDYIRHLQPNQLATFTKELFTIIQDGITREEPTVAVEPAAAESGDASDSDDSAFEGYSLGITTDKGHAADPWQPLQAAGMGLSIEVTTPTMNDISLPALDSQGNSRVTSPVHGAVADGGGPQPQPQPAPPPPRPQLQIGVSDEIVISRRSTALPNRDDPSSTQTETGPTLLSLGSAGAEPVPDVTSTVASSVNSVEPDLNLEDSPMIPMPPALRPFVATQPVTLWSKRWRYVIGDPISSAMVLGSRSGMAPSATAVPTSPVPTATNTATPSSSTAGSGTPQTTSDGLSVIGLGSPSAAGGGGVVTPSSTPSGGQGQVGSVFAATSSEFGFPVWAKRLPLSRVLNVLGSETTLRHRLLIMKRMAHRGIGSLLSAIHDADNDFLYLIHKREVGPLLRFTGAQHQSSIVDTGKVRSYMRQLIQAVVFLHKNQFIHGNLHPGNIGLSEDDAPILLDLGVSSLHRRGITGWSQSPVFTAPEVWAGAVGCDLITQQPFDPKRQSGGATADDGSTGHLLTSVDIWSLGVVLFSMVVGRLPFEVYSTAATGAGRKDSGGGGAGPPFSASSRGFGGWGVDSSSPHAASCVTPQNITLRLDASNPSAEAMTENELEEDNDNELTATADSTMNASRRANSSSPAAKKSGTPVSSCPSNTTSKEYLNRDATIAQMQQLNPMALAKMIPDTVGSSWSDLLQAMLHPDPSERIQIGALRRHPLLGERSDIFGRVSSGRGQSFTFGEGGSTAGRGSFSGTGSPFSRSSEVPNETKELEAALDVVSAIPTSPNDGIPSSPPSNSSVPAAVAGGGGGTGTGQSPGGSTSSMLPCPPRRRQDTMIHRSSSDQKLLTPPGRAVRPTVLGAHPPY